MHVWEWGAVCVGHRGSSADPAVSSVCKKRSRVGERWQGQKLCCFSISTTPGCTLCPWSCLTELHNKIKYCSNTEGPFYHPKIKSCPHVVCLPQKFSTCFCLMSNYWVIYRNKWLRLLILTYKGGSVRFNLNLNGLIYPLQYDKSATVTTAIVRLCVKRKTTSIIANSTQITPWIDWNRIWGVFRNNHKLRSSYDVWV